MRTSERYAEWRRRPHPVADVFSAPDDDRRCTRGPNLLPGAWLPEVSTFRLRSPGIFPPVALSNRAYNQGLAGDASASGERRSIPVAPCRWRMALMANGSGLF